MIIIKCCHVTARNYNQATASTKVHLNEPDIRCVDTTSKQNTAMITNYDKCIQIRNERVMTEKLLTLYLIVYPHICTRDKNLVQKNSSFRSKHLSLHIVS